MVMAAITEQTIFVGGPMFERSENGMKKIIPRDKDGAHYSVWHLDCGPYDRPDAVIGMHSLKAMFPDGEADPENFVMFSTSGIHGSYTTLEEIESTIKKYGEDLMPSSNDDWPDGFHGYNLTVLVVHPRIVCLKCGNVRVRKEDIKWLKKLRRTSLKAMAA
jgi:hypothetical protein